LIRLAIGGVSCASGLISSLYADQGAGRIDEVVIPAPEFRANFVGGVEIAAGLLLARGAVMECHPSAAHENFSARP
jgi:hypothetical protein